MILKTIDIMKKLIFLLLLALPFFGFSQAAYLMEFTNPNGSKVVFNLNDVRSCVAEGTGSYLFTRTGSGKTQVQESPATIALNSCGNIVLFTVYLPANQFNNTKQMGVNPNYVVGIVSNTSGNGVLKMVTPTENFTTTGDYDAAVSALSNCVSGGGGGGSLTNTYVGFGDGLNQLDGEAGFTYDAESNRLAVDTLKTKRISSKSGALEIFNDTKFNAYPNTRNDAGTPVNVLTTSATGVVESHPVGEFRDSLGYAWRLSSSYSSLQAAFNSPYNIVVDRSYTVTATLTVTVPKTIKGQGNITIKQVTAATSGTPIILVTASGVTIDGLKLVGQIATQTSEFSHGISLGSSIFTGMLENITVKNCEIRDCRGDGIYVASDGTIEPKNIAIQNIVARNILRNGVAVINGDNITIDGLLADSIGLYGIDVEPDATAQTNSNISINSIVVPSIGYGTHLGTQVNLNVTATNFVIDGDMYGSNPEYTVAPAYQAGKRGISIRADYNATLKGGVVKNCEYAAIELSAGGGKSKNILFEDIVFSNNGTAISGRVIDVSGGDYRNQVTFRDCDITGTGGTHLGPPDQSVWEHCKITGFTRISVAKGL